MFVLRRNLSLSALIGVTTGAVLLAGQPAIAAPLKPSEPPAIVVTERPDRVTAMTTALAQGKRVEDLSARTPSTSSFANPDGSWTLESHAGVVRAQTDPENWATVDPSVTETGKGFHPHAVPFDVEFGTGGSRDLASVTAPDGAELRLAAPAKLGQPTAKDHQVRYPFSAPGDVVVTSLPNGFNFSVELNEAPTGPDALEYRFPLGLSAGKFVERKNGSIDVVSKGEVVASISAPLMWDSSESADVVPVDTALEGAGTDRVLVLRPDLDYLTAEERIYPVTVDPTVVLTATGDTWVDSALLGGNSQYSSPELRVGTNNLGLNKARTYANFDLSSLEGSDAVVVDAKVRLTNFTTGSCSGSPIRMSQVTSAWSLTEIKWSAQPTTTATGSSTTDEAYGATACSGEGVVEFDATQIANSWISGTTNHGVQFKAENEGQNASWRKYHSLENGDTAKAPKLTVTYNHRPATPAPVTVTPSNNGGLVRSKTPEISATVTDPDGGMVAGYFEIHDSSSMVWSGTSPQVPSGGTAKVTVPTGILAEATDYVIWAFGEDDLGLRSADKAWKFINVDTIAPTVTLSSNTFTNNNWTTTVPSSSTLTMTGTSDTRGFYFTYQGTTSWLKANASGNYDLVFTPVAGWHSYAVAPLDKHGNMGDSVTFQYGTGSGSFTTPAMWTPSTASFPINVSGPPNATSANLQWRRYGATSWTTAGKVDKADGTAWTGGVTALTGRSVTNELIWHATQEPEGTGTLKAPGLLEIRSCFTYPDSSQSCTTGLLVGLHVSGFGDGRPETKLGPAQVALTNGEALIVESDAVDSKAGLGRTFSSLSDGTLGSGVFGPGWSDVQVLTPLADASASVIDNRSVDGTFVILDSERGSQTFIPTTAGSTTYKPAQATGDSTSLSLTTGTPDTLELSRPLGSSTVITTWEWAPSDTGGEDGWALKATSAPGASNDLAVTAIGQRPTFVRESEPTAASTCTASNQTSGCRALKITYTGTGAATRVSKVERVQGADAPATPSVALLATYSYTDGKLTKVCSALPAAGQPALCSEYTYTTVAGRTMLATMKPAGLTAWRFGYDSLGRLLNVKRTKPGGGDAVWSVDYNLALSAAGLPNMTAGKVTEWGQQTVPTKVYAVYAPHAGTADVTKASLFYTGSNGKTTNTATYGPEGWLVDTTWLDAHGNILQHLDGSGWARVQSVPTADRPATALEASSFTVYNTWGAADVVGTRVTDEYGPAHTASLEDGTTGYYRTHTAYVYDDTPGVDPALVADRPGSEGLGLLVKQTTSTASADRAADFEAKITKYGYAPIVDGDGNGWNLGSPTTTSVKVDANTWATSVARHDADGRIVETRQPGGGADASGAGNDARATITTYYSASGTGDCGGKPAWAGLMCKQGPAGQPAGQTMPTTHHVDFDEDLRPTTTNEISGGIVNRTVTTEYDQLGRLTVQTVATVGDGVSADAISTTYAYDPVSGLPSSVGSAGKTVDTAYDTWGRVSGYVDGAGNNSTTTYGASGEIATVTDGASSSTTAYDDRGVLQSVSGGGSIGTFTYSFRASGDLKEVTYPNGIVANYSSNEIGISTGITYSLGGSTLLAFTDGVGADGRTLRQASTASAQRFGFDGGGRLTKVEDTRSGACTTRTYDFSVASERTSRKTYGAAADGACQVSEVASARSITYDSANRPTNAGYSYDALGRSTAVPAVDTASGGEGPLSASYRANDMVKSLTQDISDGGVAHAQRVDYSLDPAGRIALVTSMSDGSETERTEYRYGSSADSPSSVRTSEDAGATWTATGYLNIPGVGLAAASTNGNVTYHINNPHGDVVATADAGATLSAYDEADEYGVRAPSTQVRYGWLGSYQRSADAVGGLMLMGVRLYNPSSGLFLSADPVLNGGANRYGYPTDPVNQLDLTGQWWGCGKTCRKYIWRGAMIAVQTAVGAICAASTGLYIACDILGGALVGAIDYYSYRKFVSRTSTSSTGAFYAALNGALTSIGGSLFSKSLTKKLKKWLWNQGKHVGYSIRRKIESFHMNWLAGIFWYAWSTATKVFYEVLARRS